MCKDMNDVFKEKSLKDQFTGGLSGSNLWIDKMSYSDPPENLRIGRRNFAYPKCRPLRKVKI